jgi:hypothetical protein
MNMHTLHKAHPLAAIDNRERFLALLHEIEGELLLTGSNRRLGASVDIVQANDKQPDHRLELDFMVVASMMNTLQTAKNVHYDNSWSKRGMLSMFMNVERKYERLDTQIFSELGDAGSETFMDTLGDFAVYAVKMFAWYAARNPQAYLRWMLEVQKEREAVFPTSVPVEEEEEVPAPIRVKHRPAPEASRTELATLACGCVGHCEGHPASVDEGA